MKQKAKFWFCPIYFYPETRKIEGRSWFSDKITLPTVQFLFFLVSGFSQIFGSLPEFPIKIEKEEA